MKCHICNGEDSIIRPVFELYDGTAICESCIKKQHKFLLTYRWKDGKMALDLPYSERKIEIHAFGDTYSNKEALKARGFIWKNGGWIAYTTPQGAIKGHEKLATVLNAYDGYKASDDEHFSK